MSLRHALFAAYVLVCALSVTGVLFRGVQTRPGLVLGLPWGLAWVVGWAVLTFVALVIFDATRPADGEEDAA
ncbi:MAG: hypothetical protein VX460_01220 [Planctomycetota bacterium]|nr:hypothetical protein [Planctomycetota bacterium]